jgi:hypothetical protein
MHKPTIITVAMLSMISQIEAMEEKQTPTEATTEEIAAKQPVVIATQETETATPADVTPEETSTTTETEEPIEQPTQEETVEVVLPDDENIQPEEEQVTITTEPIATQPDTSLTKAMTEMPEPVEEEPIIIPEEPEKTEAPAGIDTVSLENPQGNWLYKRIWWERAEERYEKIRLLVDAIWESRTIFFVKRNELDRNVLDPFYLNVGIGQGELQTILSELVDFFEKHREKQGDLNEQERSLYDTIATEEESLKQLKLDVESVANLDHAIDDALGTLMNQINRVRQYERQAWENFKEIAHILNDTKARELYYMIEGAARNIKNISSYVEQDFFNHFTKLVEEATKHIDRVQNQIESLKEKGVSFKHQTELLEQKQEQPEEEEEEEVAPKPKLSWFGWIMSGFGSISDYIFSIIRIPYDLIFGQ